MRHVQPATIFVALLLSACGSTAQTPQRAPLPTAHVSTPARAATGEHILDIPALTDGKAAPEPTPTATATRTPIATEATLPSPVPTTAPASKPAAAGTPARLVIKDIDLDRPLISVGLDQTRVPVVPKHDVGWYNLSAGPGQGENIVLWGHVLRFKSRPDIPAPFARLKELQPGAEIMLYDTAGNAYPYSVTQQVWATPDQIEYILPLGKERVTMVSCIGDKIETEGGVEMTNRLITIAEPK